MKRFSTLALMGLLALSGATMLGCSASADVEPQHSSSSMDSGTDVKKTTVYDANGNKVEQKTTETKSTY